MPWKINISDWTVQLDGTINGQYPDSLIPVASSAISMNLSLSTAGRLGFFIDYSELATVGTHTFYATRTHGSTGAVGCTWTAYDSADGTQLDTGTLSWANNSLDVLSFDVEVTSKPDGDHRIYVLLSAPTGGAVLHHGDSTVAYGIIDDDTIATSNAIFIDADAVTDGNGTQGSPYNNWYSARDALQVTDRYIYIKGLMSPNGTDLVAMSNDANHFALKATFEGRTSESQRLIIRNWCGFTGGVDGGVQTDTAGFACDGGSGSTASVRYITFRRLTIRNLDNTDAGTINGKGFFLRTRSILDDRVDFFTAERIDIDGIISGANAATSVWFVEGGSDFKLWRWNVQNTGYAAVEKADDRLPIFLSYDTKNVSIQRCTTERTAGGIYQKSGLSEVDRVGACCRFNHLKGGMIRLSTGSGRWIQDYHIVQNNIFDTPFDNFSEPPLVFDSGNQAELSEGQHISNNVFYDYDFTTYGGVSVFDVGFTKLAMFNNIFYKTSRPFRLDQNIGEAEYIDYNLYEFDGVTEPVFRVEGGNDISLQGVRDATTFEDNSTLGDPLFTNPISGDFTLQVGSSALTGGVSGSKQGVYQASFIEVGAS